MLTDAETIGRVDTALAFRTKFAYLQDQSRETLVFVVEMHALEHLLQVHRVVRNPHPNMLSDWGPLVHGECHAAVFASSTAMFRARRHTKVADKFTGW